IGQGVEAPWRLGRPRSQRAPDDERPVEPQMVFEETVSANGVRAQGNCRHTRTLRESDSKLSKSITGTYPLRVDVDEGYQGFEVDDKYRHIAAPITRFRYYGAAWLLAGYSALQAALRDDETFTSEHDLPTGSTVRVGVMTPPTAIRAVPTEVDPPDYMFYRR